MFEGRGATEVTIFNPGLTDNELSSLFTNFNTYRARAGTVIISCGDQLNGVDISLKEMLEATMKQCSMAAAFKTKVGAEGTATISLSSRKKNLFQLALNSKKFIGTGANVGKTSYSVGDDSGTRTGSVARPFKTIVFRPYEEGKPSNDVNDWIIFPAADVEGDATIAFKIGEDRGYTMTATAYDPGEKNYKAIIGDPFTVLTGTNPNPTPPPDPNDIGYDIILSIGQSNMVSHTPLESADPAIDVPNARIKQRPTNHAGANTIMDLTNPLRHPDLQGNGAISLASTFARRHLQSLPTTRTILILPQAAGGTGFGDNRWNPGNDLYNQAIASANAAIALDPTKNRITAIIWHQGENDVSMPKATYITRLDALINGMRSAITGATNVPFILGELARTWVGSDAGRLNIQQAIQETPARRTYTAVASSLSLTTYDGIHFGTQAIRDFGIRYADKITEAKNNTGSGGGGTTPPPDINIVPRWNYKFEGNFNDSSPNAYVPVIDGITIINDSTRGQVANFPGGTSEIKVASGIGAAYTKVAWVRCTNMNNSNQNIITGKDAPDNLLWCPLPGRITLGQNGSFEALVVPPANTLVLNTWTHVVATFSGTTARIFINGVQVAEKTDMSTFTGAAAPYIMNIGQYDVDNTWVGQMDDVRLYNVALTPAEVLQVYNATVL